MSRYKTAERGRLVAGARRRLLDAALEEFAAQGYAGANINRISLAAGFAQGTIYNYYASKSAIFEAVIADLAARQRELLLQGAASAPTPSARLERFLTAGFAFAQGFPAASRLVAAALHGADPEARALAERAYEPLFAYIEQEIVLAGQREGAFHAIDARLASATIMALYLGGCAAHRAGAVLRLNPRATAALILEGLRSEASNVDRHA